VYLLRFRGRSSARALRDDCWRRLMHSSSADVSICTFVLGVSICTFVLGVSIYVCASVLASPARQQLRRRQYLCFCTDSTFVLFKQVN
jgi:hypothetical protein